MTGDVRPLDAERLFRALDELDLVDVLAAELTGGVGAREPAGPAPSSRWTLETARSPDAGPELAVLSGPDAAPRLALPTADLRACRRAALTTLAARLLLAPGVVTVTVLGAGMAAHVQSAMLIRWLPDVSHVAVHSSMASPIPPELARRFASASIGLTLAASVDDAVFGATLVVVAGDEPPVLRRTRLARGAVVVNASGRELPAELVDGVSEVYVDDLALLSGQPRRYLATGAAVPDLAPGPRRRPATRRRRRVAGDLRQVLTGVDAGRSRLDDVLLVELLSADKLDARLACRVCEAAAGLGAASPV